MEKNRKVRVAEDYVKENRDLMKVDTGSSFSEEVFTLFQRTRPRKIIETGTYLGTGTTAIIAESLLRCGIEDYDFFTIEVNPEHHRQAVENLNKKGFSRVRSLNGLSIPRNLLPSLEDIDDKYVKNIEHGDIFVDHQEDKRAKLYYKETDYPGLEDDLLNKCLKSFEYKPDFVLLDSAGHMGFIEFSYVTELIKGPCWMALDDVFHVKHYKSLLLMKNDPRFEVLITSKEKFGFCIARFNP